MSRVVLSSVLALAFLVAPAAAQSSVRIAVDPALVTVGDRITITLTVDHPASARARLADSVSVEPFEVLEARVLPVEATGNEVRSTFQLTVAAFELGELEIPAIGVEIVSPNGTVEMLESDRYVVSVESVGADDSGDIREIRGPLGIPISTWVIALWVLLPLLVAALLYILVRRLGSRAEDSPLPALGPLPRPAHEVALEALAALEASPLLERGQVKEYHIAASDILRTYVEERFRVEALEMTTREVLEDLAEAGADPSFRVGLRTFLEACDLVKFAKARPSGAEARAALELGRRIILESVAEARREPEPEPEPIGVEGA